jgi:hypothetical protein
MGTDCDDRHWQLPNPGTSEHLGQAFCAHRAGAGTQHLLTWAAPGHLTPAHPSHVRDLVDSWVKSMTVWSLLRVMCLIKLNMEL